MREFVWGAYQNALPGRWLIWHGRGLYGPARYACPDHRGDLVAFLREHYGTIGFHPWKRPPYPNSLESTTPITPGRSPRAAASPAASERSSTAQGATAGWRCARLRGTLQRRCRFASSFAVSSATRSLIR